MPLKKEKISAEYLRRIRKLELEPKKKKQNNNESEEEDGGPDSQKEKSGLSLTDTVSGVSAGNLPDRKSRRQAGEIICESDNFPPVAKFQPPTKLPTLSSVIVRVRYLTPDTLSLLKAWLASWIHC